MILIIDLVILGLICTYTCDIGQSHIERDTAKNTFGRLNQISYKYHKK